MPYDPTVHHRRSIRLKNSDYAQQSAYYGTICQSDFPVFGSAIIEHVVRDNRDLARLRMYIENNPGKWIEDTLNPAGKTYFERENKYS